MDIDHGAHESPDISTRQVIAIIAGILVLLALIAFGFEALFGNRIGQTFTVSRPFPAPSVIPNERAQRLALQARQNHDLRGAHGRTPIANAMTAIAAKGSHAFDPVGREP